MSQILLFSVMVGSFAALLTSHAAIVIGLAQRAPRYRALIAVFLPPLGAAWAIREKQRLRGVTWLLAAVVYLGTRLLG